MCALRITGPAEVLSYLSIIERTDAHSIRFQGRDMIETAKFIEFMMHYEPGTDALAGSERRVRTSCPHECEARKNARQETQFSTE